MRRLLFASVHSYLDPSSGAACATRDALGLLASRGVECRSVSAGLLSYDRERPIDAVVEAVRGPDARPGDVGRDFDGWSFDLDGVGVVLMRTRSSRTPPSPDEAEARALLGLVERELERFRPQVLLTYGGHAANLALMAAARRRGVPVAFHLHNFAYDDLGTFADASAVVVPSECCRRHYARRLGLASTAIPPTVVNARILAAERSPKYVTFVNPQADKGAAVFARIASELDARRPDVPLMVVEGRGSVDDLEAVAPGTSRLRNLRATPNAADPRAIYREARVVLMPSLVRETFGRVAAEAMANGVPVLAGDRGALPETLGDAGLVLALPPDGRRPGARDVAPWVAAIERLWDDPAWEAKHRSLAAREAGRWAPAAIAARYLDFFGSIARPD